MSVNYKTLFEVRFLHEYYLINHKGESYFDLTDPLKKEDLISWKIINNQYRILDNWNISVHDESAATFEGTGMKLLQTITGCRVLIKVNKEIAGDGTITYLPAVPFSNDFRIFLRIHPKISSATSMTPYPLRADAPSVFYFSNDDPENNKTFPSLSSPVENYDDEKIYHQGDLAFFSSEGIKIFLNKKNAPLNDQWKLIGGTSFVSSSDNILLPPSFNYSFPLTANASSATFTLISTEGVTISEKTYPFNPASPSVRVDYNDISQLKDEVYLLNISAGDFITQRKVRLSKTLYSPGDIAVLDIRCGPAGNDYDLLDDDGTLKMRTLPGGLKQPHPVYEVNMKSRITYWRYISKDTRLLKPAPEILQFHADDVNGKLISKQPRPFSFSSYPFIREGTGTTDFLPQPSTVDSIVVEGSTLYADIIVPATGIFSKGP